MYTMEKGLLATADFKEEQWSKVILEQVANNPEEGAQWI
jgi:hypothetical protein